MENATKALLIAGSVFLALLVIGAFMLMMNNLSDYQQKSYQEKATAQTIEFNNLYLSYNHDKVRGSDMVSLMNRVIDYNSRKSQDGFTEMHIKINMNGKNSQLSYDNVNRLVTENSYTETTISNIVGAPNSQNGIRTIETKYGDGYANNLQAEISNIESIRNNTSLTTNEKIEQFDQEQLLPKSVKEYGGIEQVYQDALKYYEYVQFKRSYFDCTKTEYDKNTGRIINMEFKCTGVGV